MTSLLEMLLPANFLIYALNAAVASVVACAIAVVLSRRQAWSLPARHAILVAAIVASLLAPLVMPLVHLPSLWAIQVSEVVNQPLKSAETKPTESNHEQGITPEVPTANSIPRAEPSLERPPVAPPAVVSPVAVVSEPIMPAPSREQATLSTSDWVRTIGTLTCGIWLVGIVFGLARSLVCLAKLRRWTQSVTIADSPALIAAARSAADALGLRNEIVIYRSSLLPAPITCGLFRPRIVVPAGIESDLSPEQLRAVIKHEVAHLARRDLWIGLLQQVAQVMYWWNPLVHLANRQIADLREQICDDIAVRELPQPAAYAATLLKIAEQCSLCAPVPATLGFGASPAKQLESRIRRIVSSPRATCIRLSRKAAVGVLAVAVGMTATILFAQVQIKSTAAEPGGKVKEVPAKAAPAETPAKRADQQDKKGPPDPSLQDLIQQMAAYERMYLPYDIKAMETFRFPDDLTPQEKARNLRADGRKQERLMEYAQVTSRIWRDKETDVVDGEIEQGPYERFSDGERIIQVSPSSVTINGVAATEYHINSRKNQIPNYLQPTSFCGILCLASFGNGELFSQAFKDEEGVELAWDKGDAKLTFGFGKPSWNTKFVLWLSRDHAWHPIRLQRFWDAKDELFFDEWEVTKFVQRGKDWRVAEGTHRYRELKGKTVVDPKIKYSMDFKVLEEKYGSAVNEKQFQITIPAGAKVHDDKKAAEPPPPAKTREIKVTVVNVAGAPIPGATVRLPRWPFSDLDLVTTDDQGVARSAKAPVDDVSVQIAAAGFRPVTWIMGDVNELRATMAPQSPGVVVYRGHPVAEAWITNRSLQIRADGYTYVPTREWDGRDDDWSDDAGGFELKSNLTLQRRDAVVPLIAIHPNRDKMAIRFVPAGDLGKQQELALQSVCHVHGHCLLQGMPQSVEIGIGLETSTGQSIGWLSTRRELTPEGLRVDFEVRLPPGAYVLKTPQSSHHSGFTIPVAIPVDKEELDLGTKTIPAAGAILLRGKPAPELTVEWRPGQEMSWEKLRGKVVVLDFWGTWCGPCVAGMPSLMEIHDQFKGKPVEWLSIHTPNLKTFEEFDREVAKREERDWNKKKFPFTTMIDRPLPEAGYSGKTSERYGVAEWPTIIVVDQQGKVVGPVNKKKLAETITQLLDKQDVRPKTEALKSEAKGDQGAKLQRKPETGAGPKGGAGRKPLVLVGHADGVTGVAFSSDGTRVASSSRDKTIKIWDAVTGQESLTITSNSGVYSPVFSPDGKRLAAASDKTITLWNAVTGKEQRNLLTHTAMVTSVAFSRDGKRLASASGDNTVKIWDADPEAVTGEEILSLEAKGAMNVAFSPDGSRLVSGLADWNFQVWNTVTGEKLLAERGYSTGASVVAYSPDGKRLASANGRSVHLWDASKGQELLALQGHTEPVTRLAFSPDGTQLASAGWDKLVKLWNVTTGEELATFEGHGNRVTGLAFSPDGTRLATGSEDRTVRVWDLAVQGAAGK